MVRIIGMNGVALRPLGRGRLRASQDGDGIQRDQHKARILEQVIAADAELVQTDQAVNVMKADGANHHEGCKNDQPGQSHAVSPQSTPQAHQTGDQPGRGKEQQAKDEEFGMSARGRAFRIVHL